MRCGRELCQYVDLLTGDPVRSDSLEACEAKSASCFDLAALHRQQDGRTSVSRNDLKPRPKRGIHRSRHNSVGGRAAARAGNHFPRFGIGDRLDAATRQREANRVVARQRH